MVSPFVSFIFDNTSETVSLIHFMARYGLHVCVPTPTPPEIHVET